MTNVIHQPDSSYSTVFSEDNSETLFINGYLTLGKNNRAVPLEL